MTSLRAQLLLVAAAVAVGSLAGSCDCGKSTRGDAGADGGAANGGAGGRAGSSASGGKGGSGGRRARAGSGGASATGGHAGKAGQPAVVPPPITTLNRTVSKGPFLADANIVVSPIDETGNPSNRKFITRTTDDVGNFSLQFQ